MKQYKSHGYSPFVGHGDCDEGRCWSRGRSFCFRPLVCASDCWGSGRQIQKDRPFVSFVSKRTVPLFPFVSFVSAFVSAALTAAAL